MHIRELREEDLPFLLPLCDQLGYPTKLEDLRGRYRELAAAADTHKIFVACEDENILGWVQVHVEALSLVAGKRAEIGGLVVEELARGKGVGAALLKKAEEWAKEKALPLMRVRSNIKRENAHRFYRREGYAIVKSWHLFTKQI